MAIAPRPNKQPKQANPEERAAADFIAGADKKAEPQTAPPNKITTKKTGFMVYFDPEVLRKVEMMAKKSGLSRSSWIQLKAIEALENDER